MRRRQVDYEQLGASYPRHRRADPRIAARIHAELGPAGTVVNVGAGTGSYEPVDRWVLAVEPSAAMRAQRPRDAAPAIAAHAEALPLDDDAVDAAMACVTIHHWHSPAPARAARARRLAAPGRRRARALGAYRRVEARRRARRRKRRVRGAGAG